MIRLVLTGGLGNQMFQYAAAKVLSIRQNKELTIDLYALNKQTQATKRKLELDIFDLNLNISSSKKVEWLIKAYPLIDRSRFLAYKLFGYFRDKSAIVYAPEIEKLRGNIILHGNFQNEKYFEEYEDIIRKDFTFHTPLTGKNTSVASRINSTQSVSVHIRRGDYLSNAQANRSFALCDKGYYQKAINKIREEVSEPHYFIFAEDFEWVKENITFDNEPVTYVDWNEGKSSYIDMQLMSMCKHNIIANSSFSWWAAWLNRYEWKLVYAPEEWFRDDKRNKDLVNFYPENWEML